MAGKTLIPQQEQTTHDMALNLNKDLKQFYSIAEVSEMFNLPASLLRYWEKEFPTLHPKKSNSGARQYTKEDLEELRLVYDLVKVRNMKLATAREVLKRNREGVRSTNDLMERMQSVRQQLMEIKKELDALV